ncbi:MAG: gamma carbonic anhydrase family protein [Rhodospirillaceae bacterium]|mgnify:FL=1|jgi:gamma-carbonic anhydrase|nr:gamma carbonic anhydrase family protein [Rhodospirillaceae bacterium]MBT4218895.1 gamma carbonic anhydrase family protein [Rhodospirillaceae bacterium]MBT4463048.1 gamma carbonic anhydrase family protein [Rhodospirillaceae bacterium]MBT5013374.1 gamma carbonic anhydrase family protein [Rhodospirillaceae bacterium]MBT5309836.1 gamma carbonic anhydrase family protein [Rhodospirillaceae bacterium]
MTKHILPYKGTRPSISDDAFIAPNATIIGDVEIGPDTGIWFNCVIRGDVNEIRIGARTNIQDGTIIHVASQSQGTYIGDDITIGHMALIHACTLEDGCFIGMQATVMDGAHIEAGAMVAAGALVTPGKRIGGGQLWAGSPARMVRELNENDLKIMQYTAPHYVELARQYISEIGDTKA